MGVDFVSKTLAMEGAHFRLQLWDTAGGDRYLSLIPSYIRDASVVALFYDVTGTR